ncbi:MAG: GTPase HflX [Oscillospiraceae bacterium]
MFDTQEKAVRVVLCAVDTGEYDCGRSLDELAELTDTAGAEVVARIVQNRPAFDTATCMGAGKLEEVALLCEQLSADQVIFDCELTATQIRNIEEVVKLHTIDRTMLILDIFAQRAKTREGRLQVELAQYRYRLPRLAGMGVALSRLGAGIGTRGPGESKLETDRRHIRARIDALSDELKEIEKRRAFSRVRRKKDNVLVCAIVGYTNAGKSTLLNKLTGASAFAEDKLFATLETTARAAELPDGRSVTFVDTVGFISRLPHHLVEAFKSTLEEAVQADVLIHLADASAPDFAEKSTVTRRLLSELGCDGIPVVTALNKCDLIPAEQPDEPVAGTVRISAKTGAGLDELLAEITKALPDAPVRAKLLLPFDKAALAAKIRTDGKIFSEEYTPDGLLLDALIDRKRFHEIERFRF